MGYVRDKIRANTARRNPGGLPSPVTGTYRIKLSGLDRYTLAHVFREHSYEYESDYGNEHQYLLYALSDKIKNARGYLDVKSYELRWLVGSLYWYLDTYAWRNNEEMGRAARRLHNRLDSRLNKVRKSPHYRKNPQPRRAKLHSLQNPRRAGATRQERNQAMATDIHNKVNVLRKMKGPQDIPGAPVPRPVKDHWRAARKSWSKYENRTWWGLSEEDRSGFTDPAHRAIYDKMILFPQWKKEYIEVLISSLPHRSKMNPKKKTRRGASQTKARQNGFLLEPWDLAENNGFTVHGGFTSHRDPLITILFVSKEGERGLMVVRSVKTKYGDETAVEGELIPEGWGFPKEVEEWAKLNSGSGQSRIDKLTLAAAGYFVQHNEGARLDLRSIARGWEDYDSGIGWTAEEAKIILREWKAMDEACAKPYGRW